MTKLTPDARFRARSVTFRARLGEGTSGTSRRARAMALDSCFIRQGRPDEIQHFKERRFGVRAKNAKGPRCFRPQHPNDMAASHARGKFDQLASCRGSGKPLPRRTAATYDCWTAPAPAGVGISSLPGVGVEGSRPPLLSTDAEPIPNGEREGEKDGARNEPLAETKPKLSPTKSQPISVQIIR